jgi:hypothetical protein
MASLEEILKGKSNKVLLWVIGVLLTALSVLGIYVWNKLTNDDSAVKIEKLQNDLIDIKTFIIQSIITNNTAVLEKASNDAIKKDSKVIAYNDNRLNLVVSNIDSKNKVMLQQMLEITKDQPAVIEYRFPDVKDTIIYRTIYKVDTLRNRVIVKDTMAKKKGLARLKFW